MISPDVIDDYGAVRAVDVADARQVLENARAFSVAANAYLVSPGPA